MNTASIRPTLRVQFSRVLEATAFMPVQSVDGPLPQPGPAVEASLAFSGLCSGTCWLAVDDEGAKQLAVEMLGTEPPDESNNHAEAVGEFLNILATWFLDAWWGNDVERDIRTPTVVSRPLSETVAWSLPPEQKLVVTTDCGHTFICGVAIDKR